MSQLVKKIRYVRSNNIKIEWVIIYISKKRLLCKKLYKNGWISKIIKFNCSLSMKIYNNHYHYNNYIYLPFALETEWINFEFRIDN